MSSDKRFIGQLGILGRRLADAGSGINSFGKTALGAIAAIVLLLGNMGRSLYSGAAQIRDRAFQPAQKTGEVIQVKKSTVVALLVTLAAVAGVLGALYFYVLRREKELDEYEQLLFSEDFGDDDDGEDGEEEADETPDEDAE